MFIGAMIMGPLAAYVMKRLDALWEGKVKAGFEMLVNMFSAGITAFVMSIVGFFALAPIVNGVMEALGNAVETLVDNDLLPLTSIIIEPAKVLFLNNAINHGVLTPLGIQEAAEQGKSVLFLLEANPGPGLGLLMAYTFFGKGVAKATAPGAAIIQFFGGIHEVYFPYVLMKPKLILAMILGGMTGVFVNVTFDVGLRAPAAPGSIFAVYAQTAKGDYLGVTAGVFSAARGHLPGRGSAPEDGERRRGGRPGCRDRGHGVHEGQARRSPPLCWAVGRTTSTVRSGRSCSPATRAWAPPPWAPRCSAGRSRTPGTVRSRSSTRRSPT